MANQRLALGLFSIAILLLSAPALANEDVAIKDDGITFSGLNSQTFESSHPYANNMSVIQQYTFTHPNVVAVTVSFDSQSQTESCCDSLSFTYTNASGAQVTNSNRGSNIIGAAIQSNQFTMNFHSDSSRAYYGYKVTLTPVTQSDCVSFSNDDGATFSGMEAQTLESAHPYCKQMRVVQDYTFSASGVVAVALDFDPSSYTETSSDSLTISYTNTWGVDIRTTFAGSNFSNTIIQSNTFTLTFHSDTSKNYYGYKFTATPATNSDCLDFTQNNGGSFGGLASQTIESAHPYCNKMDVTQSYDFTGAGVVAVDLVFDQAQTESCCDTLVVNYTNASGNETATTFRGSSFSNMTVQSNSFTLTFHSDTSHAYYGYKIIATPATHSACIDYSNNHGSTFSGTEPQVIESAHPYCNQMDVTQNYSFTDPSIVAVGFVFDSQSRVESGSDYLTISHTDASGDQNDGRGFSARTVLSNNFTFAFHSDHSNVYYGFKVTATPLTACDIFSNNTGARYNGSSPRVIESAHPYCNNMNVTQHYDFPSWGIAAVDLHFDEQSHIEDHWDNLVITYTNSAGTAVTTTFTGDGTDLHDLTVESDSFDLTFTSDGSFTFWGYSITATPNRGTAAAAAASIDTKKMSPDELAMLINLYMTKKEQGH